MGEERGLVWGEVYALDSTMVKVHPDAHGAEKTADRG
jgi:hypothetical protein